ncbi:hypothetical protein [Marinobacter sp. JSM 1782161]|uniref:hypothetical protein n=1 Tax=Marinobacter sp. JSM 1782161 TaxID=2685906 RepID=UPI001402EE33|nr:hypothetical protein [Marinobacter sp. JSM 1782161]
MQDVIPRTYQEWKHCITIDCGIALTRDFCRQRLKALHDSSDHMTGRFVERWGEAQRQQSIAWFERALSELDGMEGD